MTTESATTLMNVRAERADGGGAHWFHDLLSFDQERALIERVRGGDRCARDELILKNQRLVVSIARRHARRVHELDDLVSVGNRGLIRAVEKFDPARGVRFATYAVRWIRSMIAREICAMRRPIRIARWVAELAGAYRRVERRLRYDEGEPPGFDRVCALMKLSAGQSRCLADALAVERAEFRCGGGNLVDRRQAPPDRTAEQSELPAALDSIIDRLPPRQAQAVRLHYGLGGEPALSLGEIGRGQRCSWQSVQNARNEGLARLRTMPGAIELGRW